MEKRIRRLGIFMVLCFLALLIPAQQHPGVKAHSLATSSENPAVIQSERSQPRGEILAADGTVLPQSVLAPAGGLYKYQRMYPAATAGLFANIVGWDSINYGKLGVEASYNQYLEAHNRAPTSLRDLFSNNSTVTDQRHPHHLQPKFAGGGKRHNPVARDGTARGSRGQHPGVGRGARPEDRCHPGHVLDANLRPEPPRLSRRQGC